MPELHVRQKFMNKTTAILLTTILCMLNVQAEKLPFPFVAVDGSAVTEVKPNEATIHLSFLTHAESSKEAVQQMAKAFESALKIVAEHGLSEETLTAGDLSKKAIRERGENSYLPLGIIGYDIRRSLSIELNELGDYPTITESLSELDGLERISTSFRSSDDEEFENELIAEACADAKKKAERLAQGLGMKVGSVYAVKRDGTFDSNWATFSLDAFFTTLSSGWVGGAPGGAESQLDMTYFVPATIEKNALVHVIYKLKE